ncbi:P-loop containing nucleoside triphosphate hydrolase protein [Sparassis latifolia]
MGQTGTGKSTFINKATNSDLATVGDSLRACTSRVNAIRYPHPFDGRPIVFVDTPGFDDTNKSDLDILKMVADWLTKTYKKGFKLTAIIYLHRISDKRMTGAAHNNLVMFKQLCGEKAFQNVIVATTMWGRMTPEVGEQREKELQDKFWKRMLDLGSATARFHDNFESAWSVVDSILSDHPTPRALLLQEEMVDLQKPLNETSAGKELYERLRGLHGRQEQVLRELRQQARGQAAAQFATELEDVEQQIRLLLVQIQEMRVPLGRRILMFFTFRSCFKVGTSPVRVLGLLIAIPRTLT